MRKENGYWTKEKCKEEALLYKTRKEFFNNNQSAYTIASNNKWLDDICEHMILNKLMNYWTKEKCLEKSLLCKSKNEFRNKYETAYKKSLKYNWLDEICSHMQPNGNLYKRLVYSYEFDDKSIYVGLTCNSNRRYLEHYTTNTSVNKYILKTGKIPKFKILTDYLEIGNAIEMEKYYVQHYKEIGYNVLNKNKAGGLGGGKIKWTYDECRKESLKYKNRREFSAKKRRAYDKCKKEGWLEYFFNR